MFGNTLPKLKKSLTYAKEVPDTMEEMQKGAIVLSVCQSGDSVPAMVSPRTLVEVLGVANNTFNSFPMITIKDHETGAVTHYTIDTWESPPALREIDDYNWFWNYWVDGWDDYSNTRHMIQEMLDDETAEFGVEDDKLVLMGLLCGSD